MKTGAQGAAPSSVAGPVDYVPLGGLRFILSFLVFLGHAFAPFLRPYQGIGLQSCGVAVFFVVSGYVIVSAYYQFYQREVPRFLLNRFLRIFPPFWATYVLALALAMLVSDPDLAQLDVREIVGTSSILGGLAGVSHLLYVAHAWTLAVEVQFYLAAAAVFVIMQRLGHGRQAVWVLIGGAVAAYGFVFAVNGHNRIFGALQYGPFFALGAAAFAIRWRMVGAKAGWALVAVLTAVSLHQYYYYISHTWLNSPLVLVAFAVFLAVTAVFLWLSMRTASGHMAAIDRRLGALTYHFYLAHLPVLAVLEAAGLYKSMGAIPGALALSLVATLLLEQVSDKPVTLLRDRVRGRKIA